MILQQDQNGKPDDPIPPWISDGGLTTLLLLHLLKKKGGAFQVDLHSLRLQLRR